MIFFSFLTHATKTMMFTPQDCVGIRMAISEDSAGAPKIAEVLKH